ncbi:CAP domain-containing protein [Corynebacterium matruchotii]|uniref:CAP domain-containing protein n=1 Tax=Corynebacterium matruchotii TaxID=43768 RepID=UPI0028F0AE21|nr:CAP domain-containing protein [Corynebacterium matruchotii]
MSHHSLPKKWRRSAVTAVLVPSLMCGGHAVVAPTASAAPGSSAGSGNVGSTGSAALPGIPDNIIRVLGPALPIVAFLATVFAAATAFSRSGSHTSRISSTSTNPSPSASAEATTSGSQQPTTPSTSVEAPAPAASEHPTVTAEAARPVQTNGTVNQGSKTGSSNPNNRGAGTTGGASTSTAPWKPEAGTEDTSQQIQRLLDAINKPRIAKNLQPVTLDTALSAKQQARADEFLKSGGRVFDDSGSVVIVSGPDPVESYQKTLKEQDYFRQLAERPDVTKVGIGLAGNEDGSWWGGFVHFQSEGEALSTNEQRMTKLVEKLNAARAARGAGALQLAPSFNPEEQQWAQHMKDQNKAYYQGYFRAVGRNRDPLAVVDSWDTPGFREILTGKKYTHVAIGLVQSGNEWFVSARPLTSGQIASDQQRIDTIVRQINAERAKKNLAALTLDAKLSASMQNDAEKFSRTERVEFPMPRRVVFDLTADPTESVSTWLGDNKSRDVIMNPKATKVGVALAQNNGLFGVAGIIN